MQTMDQMYSDFSRKFTQCMYVVWAAPRTTFCSWMSHHGILGSSSPQNASRPTVAMNTFIMYSTCCKECALHITPDDKTAHCLNYSRHSRPGHKLHSCPSHASHAALAESIYNVGHDSGHHAQTCTNRPTTHQRQQH